MWPEKWRMSCRLAVRVTGPQTQRVVAVDLGRGLSPARLYGEKPAALRTCCPWALVTRLMNCWLSEVFLDCFRVTIW